MPRFLFLLLVLLPFLPALFLTLAPSLTGGWNSLGATEHFWWPDAFGRGTARCAPPECIGPWRQRSPARAGSKNYLPHPNSAVSRQLQTQPDDPRYADQWALPLIGAPCIWPLTTGSRRVTVAVIDSGVDFNHPDLQGHVRADGYDFVDNDSIPNDTYGHGTHVSGIIAASINNAEGIAGLAPHVQLLPVRVLDETGMGNDETAAQGIRYAVDHGAAIINLSLGATLWSSIQDAEHVKRSSVGAAVRAAQQAGVLVVVAAGNDFVPLPNIIAFENPDVLLVAASDQEDLRAPFSNSGPWVDVVAPGQHILSTMPTYEVYLTSSKLPPDQRLQPTYDYMSGTSQAAPYVSALAALLLSAYPGASAADVQIAIEAGASMDMYNHYPPEYRRLWELGAGRIDACAIPVAQ